MIHRSFTTSSCVGASRAIVCVSKLLKVSSAQKSLVALVELQVPMEVEELPRVVAKQALCSQLHRPRFPVHSVKIRCQVLRPASCQSIVRPAAIVGLFGPSPHHLLCQQVPCSIHPSVPSTFPCSNRESRGPRRGLDGCKGIHHTRSPNCSKGEQRAFPHFVHTAVLPSRSNANRRCMLAAYGTSHVNRYAVLLVLRHSKLTPLPV